MEEDLENPSARNSISRQLWNVAIRSPGGNAFLATLLALGILIMAWWSASQWYRTQLLNDLRGEMEAEVALRGNTLGAVMNRRLALLEGLGAFVRTGQESAGFEARFQAYAADLFDSAPGLRNFVLAPDGVVRSIFPIEGNEALLGYEPLSDPRPEIRDDVILAMETREIVLSGPQELVQGGLGFVARKAIFVGNEFWGFTNIVLDAPPIFTRAGLDGSGSGLILVLYNQNGKFLYGSAGILNQQPVFTRIDLPGAQWWLAGVPEQGWEEAIAPNLGIFQGAGLTIVLLICSLIFVSVNRQARLAVAVEQRTRLVSRINERLKKDIAERKRAEEALKEREGQYRSIFETVRDGLFINDLDGRLVGFNPAAHEMHGYTREEFSSLQPLEFIHPDSHPIFKEYIEAIRAGEQFRAAAMDIKKDGTPIHIEVFGTPFTYQGAPHTLAVVRDVTEQIQAFQLLENRVHERTKALSTLLEISQRIASTLELKPLLDQILDQIQKIVDYSSASVLTLEGKTLTLRATRGPEPMENVSRQSYELEEAPHFGAVVDGGVPVIIDDTRVDNDLAEGYRKIAARETAGPDQVRCWMGVPLMLKGEVIGMLSFEHHQQTHYQQEDASLATAFANQAVVAIENARLYEQASALASLQERQRLARELHDSVSQALYGIGLGTRTLQTMIENLGEPQIEKALAEPLDYVIGLADAGLAEMRALIFELRPDSLEAEGLVSALKKQARSMRARHQLQVDMYFCDEPELPLESKQALYRIAQEALHNTVKHARAGRVRVSLAAENGWLSLILEDDGKGFDTSAEFPGHLGLQSMQERAEALGGSFSVESSEGTGTIITAQIPL